MTLRGGGPTKLPKTVKHFCLKQMPVGKEVEIKVTVIVEFNERFQAVCVEILDEEVSQVFFFNP